MSPSLKSLAICVVALGPASLAGGATVPEFLEAETVKLVTGGSGASGAQAVRQLVQNSGSAPAVQDAAPVPERRDLTEMEKRAVNAALDYLKKNPRLIGDQTKVLPEVKSVRSWVIPGQPVDGIRGPDGRGQRPRGRPPVFVSEITFEAQRHNNVPVHGTELVARVENEAVVEGSARNPWHRFEDIRVPLTPQRADEEVRRGLIGLELAYGDAAGQPRKYAIRAEDVREKGQLTVLPMAREGAAPEFKLVWAIKVGNSMSWILYVDSATGKILRTQQLFQTVN